jgi:hypothetical protein
MGYNNDVHAVMKYKNKIHSAMDELNNNNKATWNHNFSNMPHCIKKVIDMIAEEEDMDHDEVQDLVVDYLQKKYPTENLASLQAEYNYSGGKRKTHRRGRGRGRGRGRSHGRKTHRGGKKSRKSRRGGKKSRRATRRRR